MEYPEEIRVNASGAFRSLFEAFALGIEEGFAVFRGEVIGFVHFPLIGERRPEHFAVALKLVFPEPLFNQQGKTVTFAQVLDEVDLRSENIRNAHGQNGRFTVEASVSNKLERMVPLTRTRLKS